MTAACVICLAVAGAQAPVYGFMEEVTGPSDCVAACGNGGLTAGVTASGRVSVCRWPSPSYYSQVTFRSSPGKIPPEGVAREDGLVWGLRYGGVTHWLDDESGPPDSRNVTSDGVTIATRTTVPGLPRPVEQELFIDGKRNLLVARLRPGPDTKVRIFWYANFSPCTRIVPEVPLADWVCPALNDFAAFADASSGTIYHFRPSDPSSDDRRMARIWEAAPSPTPQPELVREGTWIAYRPAGGMSSFACAAATGPDSALGQADAGTLSGSIVAVRECASVAEVLPEDAGDGATATVIAAFGKSKNEVDKLLAYAREQGYDGLLQETRERNRVWLKQAAWPATLPSPLLSELRRCLETLRVATDRASGAIVRAPLSQPTLALDIPRHSIWAGLALDMAGYPAEAGKHLEFLLSCVRTEDKPGAPAGSLPAALYGDGQTGAPHFILDGEASGWLLWAIWQHAGFLTGQEHTEFLERAWPSADLLAAFLMNRADPRMGVPVYAFDPATLRDNATLTFLASAYTGLRSASAIARALAHERPEWQERLGDLEDALKTRAFDPLGHWAVARPLDLWTTGIIDAGDPRWHAVGDRVMASLPAGPADQALRDLCALSMLWRDQPEQLAKLRPLLAGTISEARRRRPVDSLDAARAVIAALTLYGEKVLP